jgi:hypothetical protein
MRRMRRPLMLALTACLAAIGVAAADGASIKTEMSSVIDPSSTLIFTIGGEVDPANAPGAPTTPERWAQAADAAGKLKDEANWLMLKGQAKDHGFWMSDAKLLRGAAAAAERAAIAHNAGDFSAAANNLGDTCTTCHSRYKPQTAG